MADPMERPRPQTDRGQQQSRWEPDATRSVRTETPQAHYRQPSIDEALEEGRRRRDDGQRSAEYGTDVVWRRTFETVLERWAASGLAFTVNEILAEVGPPPAGTSKVFGALIAGASRRGLIRKVGVRQSPKASRNGGWTFEWQGVSR